MKANIPEVAKKGIVVIGGGFAGLTLTVKLIKSNYQVVLIDKHNYHMFQPLFYQVVTAGIEPSAISFPFRKVFQSKRNIHIRITEIIRIEPKNNWVIPKVGLVNYDYLVIAMGDIALMVTEKYPKGHAQVAQVAIQQATNLANNFKK